ncbi:MAG: alpha/beta fold hydrolase [Verrucomicrobiales bacterium]|nr:alpha/beta fold hydrolase [Verrucomicrobiales bacterium]
MIPVYFATNRNSISDGKTHFGDRFHADGPMFYRVGKAQLSETNSQDPDEKYAVRQVEVFPEIAEDGVEKLVGSKKFFEDLRREISVDRRDVVVLIHGFACDFETSLKRAAQIKQAYLIERRSSENDGGSSGDVYEPHVVVFSWPSNGRVSPPWEYHNDRMDAAASGVAVARFMRRLVDFLTDQESGRCEQGIHLVAHSMGNWALRHAVLSLASLVDQAHLPTIFSNAFLMAADEDDDTFEVDHKMERLPELAAAIHVYHSRGDKALLISDTTKFNPNRLGVHGPKSFSGLSTRIVAIDCSRCDHTKTAHANHQYYRIRKEVIADVRAVLSGRFLPDQVPGRLEVESGRRYRIDPSAAPSAGG